MSATLDTEVAQLHRLMAVEGAAHHAAALRRWLDEHEVGDRARAELAHLLDDAWDLGYIAGCEADGDARDQVRWVRMMCAVVPEGEA